METATVEMPRHRLAWAALVSAAVVSAALVSAAPTAWALDVRTIALSSDPAPGVAGGFSTFGAPILNNFGDLTFAATTDNDNAPTGVWLEYFQTLSLVAAEGQIAPDSGGRTFDPFDDPNLRLFINNVGQAGFGHTLSNTSFGGAFSQTGIGDALEKVAIGSDPAPDTNDPARIFQTFFGTVGGFNEFGETAFRGSMPPTAGPGNFPSNGIWRGVPTILNKLAEIGDPAPGTASSFNDGFGLPTINDVRNTAFKAGYGGGAGVFYHTFIGDSLTPVALTSQPAPGTGGRTFSILFGDTVSLNTDNDLAFSATLNGLIDGGLRDGVWVRRDGAVELSAFESQTAPGLSQTLEQIETSVIGLDQDGDAFFTARLSDGRRGLFGEIDGVLETIAVGSFGSPAAGDVAPGGSTFINIVRWAVSDDGQVAFLASLSDSSQALFATDTLGNLQRIVGQGDVLEVAPGDLRTIEQLNFFGLDGSIGSFGNNASSGWATDGQLAFQATFVDPDSGEITQGVFVTTVNVIPEPAALAALPAALLTLRRRRP